jgi:TRAP-type mannitol/chloroaromatic compound transport system substrate-binding protein
MRQQLLAIGAAVALSGAVAAGTAAAAEKWSMATAWGGGPLLELMAKGAAADIGLLTDGEIEVEVFPGGTLGSPLKVTNTIEKGVAQIGHNWAGYDWGIDRTAVLFGGFAGSLPPVEMLHWMYKGGGLQLYQEWRMEKFGVVVFPCGSIPREIFMHSHKKVETLADFKGMKVRTSGAWAEIAQSLGASTVILAGAEVYPALERKVVDAIEWGTPSMNESHGFAKVAEYIILPGLHQPVAFQECEINKAAWDKLSDRNKKLIELATRDTTLNVWMQIGHDDAISFQKYIDAGSQVVDVDDAFKAEAAKATADWAAKQAAENAWFKRVWEHQQAYAKQWAQAERYR